ncbi:AaceriACR227Wp [[Ashbya] aceris (nom. inval.)]|nr:AaceriACR227Wp [[Ashbya] aceris (nom. inval.)]
MESPCPYPPLDQTDQQKSSTAYEECAVYPESSYLHSLVENGGVPGEPQVGKVLPPMDGLQLMATDQINTIQLDDDVPVLDDRPVLSAGQPPPELQALDFVTMADSFQPQVDALNAAPYINIELTGAYDNEELSEKPQLAAGPLSEDARASGSSTSSRAQGCSSLSLLNSQSTSTMHLGSSHGMRSSVAGSYDSRKPKIKPVDLSHLYLVNNSDSITLTQTNESVAHFSHKMISECLGDDSDSVLVPRLKALEMYKKNVKKSKDPDVLFQYAQYMLQTALTMDVSPISETDDPRKKGLCRKLSPTESLKEQFLKEAKVYLTKLSVKGYKDAQYLLADAYSSGAFGKVNHKDAFILFQSSAKHGHVEAAYRTAVCFEKGLGTTRDSRKCIEFLKFAASKNHPAAMFKLGLYSFHGRMGLPNDVNTKQNGIKWLSRAAARATELTCAAPYELAQIYENGFLDIIIPDESYATELYLQAAALGHVPSTTKLGKLYEQGNEIVPQDTSLSVHYYTDAAMKGDPEAMLGLCAWYLIGAQPAFDRDDREAFQWALKAAKKGYGKAQYTVGYFHENGKGCKKDIDMAYKWYECAADNDDPRALRKLASRKDKKKRNSTVFNFSFLKPDDFESKLQRMDVGDYSPLCLDFQGTLARTNAASRSRHGINTSCSYDVINVITDDQSLGMEMDDNGAQCPAQQRCLTPISRQTSSFLSEVSPYQSSNNPMAPNYVAENQPVELRPVATGQTSNSSTSCAPREKDQEMLPSNIPGERWHASAAPEGTSFNNVAPKKVTDRNGCVIT